jgi:PAS domain S-box-containing protein
MISVFERFSLRRFLTINFFVVAIVPVLIMGFISLYLMQNYLRDGVRKKNFILTQSLASEVVIFVKEPLSLLRQVEAVLGQQQLLPDKAIDAYLSTIVTTYVYFDRLMIIDRDGVVAHASLTNQEDIGTSALGQDFFQETMARQEPYWSPSFISLSTGQPTVSLSIPLKEGVVVGFLNLDVLSGLAQKYQVDNNNHAMITDQDGVAIVHFNRAMVAERVDFKNLEEIRQGRLGNEGTFQRISELDSQKEELVSVVIVPATGWLVSIHRDVGEVYAPLHSLTRLMAGTVFFTILLTLLVAVYCLRKVFGPISHFLQSTKMISQGQYDIKVPESFSEMNELGQHFRDMVSSIQRRERDLHYRLDSEALLSKISRIFMLLSLSGWDAGVSRSLALAGEFLQVDRISIFVYNDQEDRLSCRHEWCGAGVGSSKATLQELPVDQYDWFHNQFRDKGTVTIGRLSEMPPEAEGERQQFKMQGIKSILCLPMYSGEQLVAFIGFVRLEEEREWSGEQIALFQLLRDLFLQSMLRQHSRQQVERLQLAIDQAAEFVLLLDGDGRIEYANAIFAEACGVESGSEVVGTLYRDLPPAGMSGDLFTSIWALNCKDQGWTGRLSGQQFDGDGLQQELTISPIREADGSVLLYVMVGRDISKQLELESYLQQAQKMESIGTLAGGIAHDFNNILSAIMGYTELARLYTDDDHPSVPHLTEVSRASRRAADLVSQILTFSRKEQRELVATNIQPIIKEPLKLLRASLPTTIDLRQQIGVTGQVQVDGTQLHQVMMNICTNASHAMTGGGILEVCLSEVEQDEKDLRFIPDLEPGTYAKLTISDTGCGMSRQVMDHIFDPYFTTKEQGKGTGLGLAVVQGIVKSFGGDISVQSQLGQGTIFTILLPVVETVAEDESLRGELGEVPGGEERILLVDDEDALVHLLTMILEGLGYTVSPFTSSAKALEAFRSAPQDFDMVISDMTMPEMTGLQLAAEIGTIRENTPFVICTGYSDGLGPDTMEQFGVDCVLSKPVQRRELALAIRQILD